MHWMWALATSLGFPYMFMRMFLACVYSSLLKRNPSMSALTLGRSSSFKYENLATWPMFDLSLSALNCPLSLCQSRCVSWHFVMTSLGSSWSQVSLFPLSPEFLLLLIPFTFVPALLILRPLSRTYRTLLSSFSSPRKVLSTCTIAFVSWHSSTLLSMNFRCLYIGFKKLLPANLVCVFVRQRQYF